MADRLQRAAQVDEEASELLLAREIGAVLVSLADRLETLRVLARDGDEEAAERLRREEQRRGIETCSL